MVSDLEKLAGKKAVVTGAAGFLGSNLVRRLLEEKMEVTAVTLPGEDTANLVGLDGKVTLIERRVDSSSYTDTLIKGQDFLFHFAWQTDLERSLADPIRDLQIDVGGTLSILEAARVHNPKIKIVFPSTVTVIGTPQNLPVDETHPENPPSPYDINKLMAERYFGVYFREHGIRSTCLRLANVFGEHQRIDNPRRGILNFFVGRALRGQEITIYGDGELIRDYSYVQNFIDAFILAAKTPSTDGKSYVLSSGEGKSFNQVAKTVQELALEIYGKRVEIAHVPIPRDTSPINLRNFVGNSSKFKGDTNWYPQVGFREGLRRTMEFYKP